MKVDIGVRNIPTAETMVIMMDKDIAALLPHVLSSLGTGDIFIKILSKAAINPLLIYKIQYYTWNSKTITVTPPKDAKTAKKKNIEDAAWYQKEFGSRIKKNGKKQKKYVALEDVFNLGDNHIFKTLNKRPGKYAGSSGAVIINLGNKKRPGIINVNKDDDHMSGVTGILVVSKDKLIGMSKDDSIEMQIKKSDFSENVGKQGPIPAGNDKSCCEASDDEETLSSSNDSASSSSSGEEARSGNSAGSSG